MLPELVRRGVVPDVLTDQTSAHDELNGYVPNGMTLAEAEALRAADPDDYIRRAVAAMGVHVAAMLDLQKRGAVTFDYGNNIRAQAVKAGVATAFDIPGFVPEYIRPLFCEGKGPFRWAALSGDPADIHATDEAALEMFAHDEALCRWVRMARERVAFQGLPARIFWLGYGERARFGLRINELVRQGVIKAPIVIGRDHLDTGSVASPNRETEGMRDGSDAIADWPILNALLNASSGATWVSVHHGGGVGIGYSIHAGMVIVADGTREADEKLQRVLTCDPGMGVVRHADAGYEDAIATAEARGVRIPMREFGPAALERPPRGRRERPAVTTPPTVDQRIKATLSQDAGRIPVVLGLCGSGRTSLLQRLHAEFGPDGSQYINVERTATTPERFLNALTAGSPFIEARPAPTTLSPREAFDATLAFFAGARRADQGPVTFLLDEVLEFRTFESFPGLRRALPELLAVMASSPNRFVLTSRYVTRTERALASASPQFVVVPMGRITDAELAREVDVPARTRRRRAGDRWRRGRGPRQPGLATLGRAGLLRLRDRGRHGGAPPAHPRPGGRTGGAARRPGACLVALRVHLRAAAAPRAGLRRPEGDPRDPRHPGAADADRDLEAPRADARLDEGLPVVAGGRGPDLGASEALPLPRPAAADVGQAPLPAGAADGGGDRARGAAHAAACLTTPAQV